MPNRRQAVICTNADPIYWLVYAALGGRWVHSLRPAGSYVAANQIAPKQSLQNFAHYDACAVVACAKICSDSFSVIWLRAPCAWKLTAGDQIAAVEFLISAEIQGEKSVVNWTPLSLSIEWPNYSLKLLWILRELLSICSLTQEIGYHPCSKTYWMNKPVWLETHHLIAHLWHFNLFNIFATSNVDSIVNILKKYILNANSFNPHKKPIPLFNMATCTQSMQRTWWPVASTTIVTAKVQFQ